MAFIKKYVDLDEYKDEETILKVFRSYGCELKQIGKHHNAYLCLSPFTKERTPSCRIQSIKRGKTRNVPVWGYKDFSSGSGGDVFTLIMRKQGVDFFTALWIVTKRIAPYKEPARHVDPLQMQIIFPAETKEEFVRINFPF